MEKNLSFSAHAITRVRLKLTWAQLEVVSTQQESFQLYIAGDDDSVEELRIEDTGETLLAAQPQLGYAKEILPRRRWLQICLRIPQSWRGDVHADTVSGIAGMHGIAGNEISLSSVNGSINVHDIETSLLGLHSVSGAIAGERLKAQRTNLRSVSGAIKLFALTSLSTKLFTVSGDAVLDLDAGCRILDLQSVSGAFTVETDGPVKASLHSLSGQFLLADELADLKGRPQDGEKADVSAGRLEITASSVSGDLAVRGRTKRDAPVKA